MNSRAAVEETAEERANFNSIGVEEEIIELQVVVVFTYYALYIIMHHITYHIINLINLQDLRMSPIPSLRNRHKAKYYKEPGGRLHGMCPSQVFISWPLMKTCMALKYLNCVFMRMLQCVNS